MPTQGKSIAIRQILALYNKLLMLLALSWLWVTSSKRGANWETALPAKSVQLMHYLLTMINWIRLCDNLIQGIYIYTKKSTKTSWKQKCSLSSDFYFFALGPKLLNQRPEHWPSQYWLRSRMLITCRSMLGGHQTTTLNYSCPVLWGAADKWVLLWILDQKLLRASQVPVDDMDESFVKLSRAYNRHGWRSYSCMDWLQLAPAIEAN